MKLSKTSVGPLVGLLLVVAIGIAFYLLAHSGPVTEEGEGSVAQRRPLVWLLLDGSGVER